MFKSAVEGGHQSALDRHAKHSGMDELAALFPTIANSVFSERNVTSTASLRSYLTERSALSVTSTTGVDLAASVLSETFGSSFLRRTRGFATAGGFPVVDPREIPRALSVLKVEVGSRANPLEKMGLLGLGLILIHPLTDGNGRLARMVWCRGMIEIGLRPQHIAHGFDLFYANDGLPAWQTCRAAADGNEHLFLMRWGWAFDDPKRTYP